MNEADALRIQQNELIRALQRTLELHCPGEADHAERVAVYSVATAHELGVSEAELLDIRRAAALHDIGKVAVDRDLLVKPGGLSDEDIVALRLHAELSIRVLEGIEWLAEAALMVRHHHEHWDGGGYPDGLQGDEIPLGSRIIGVAEAFDVMTMASPFRELRMPEEALAELERCAGTQFDPGVVSAFGRIQALVQPIGMKG